MTDGVTGLVWLKSANCLGTPANPMSGRIDWKEASDWAAALASGTVCGDEIVLTDNSSAGQWRLPTIDEWEDITGDHQDNGMLLPGASPCYPKIRNDSGTGCWSAGPTSFSQAQSINYWSSTTDATSASSAWVTYMVVGGVSTVAKVNDVFAWPVRFAPCR